MLTTPPKIVHIAGWNSCSFFTKTLQVVNTLKLLFPSRLQLIDHSFPNRDAYRTWLVEGGFRENLLEDRAKTHTSSPFVWTSNSLKTDPPDCTSTFVGGHDDTLQWCRNFCQPSEAEVQDSLPSMIMKPDDHTSSHDYEYDLIVIGGGSGGLAASKEAARHGAKVAVLDYVKPSPAGTTWGLGGTCVNVGCIPKKLFHCASLYQEGHIRDARGFGANDNEKEVPSWETLRQHVQNYIHGLNFKYRVNLREEKVMYFQKLAKFLDAHTLQVTDKKQRVSTMTSSRFLIAVGGRPTPLTCEGGELAISSDDVFSLPHSPGKTLCVGASYIALECAGFLAGLGMEVEVAVRSLLLRGFDRECAEKIGEYMEGHGVTFKRQVVPVKLEKVMVDGSLRNNNRIRVTFSDDSQDVYDTVLVAIGRTADTKDLGLDQIDLSVKESNRKISTIHEQTPCTNVYAVGDVVEGCPELTPVAIQAGVLLARRLFQTKAKELMDYTNVCTTVFTPIEYGTVGYSEEEAMERFGKNNVEVYHKEFMPLEWALSELREDHPAFTKVLVDKTNGDKIIGLHFLGPNAGEVVQGYGVAIKKGITFQELQDTVGIHPTSAEEIVTLSVSKSSGKDAKAGGC